jgi:hypothetical protein
VEKVRCLHIQNNDILPKSTHVYKNKRINLIYFAKQWVSTKNLLGAKIKLKKKSYFRSVQLDD